MLDLTPFVAIFVVLGVITLALAAYRKAVSSGEEDVVHLGPGEERRIPEQKALAGRLSAIDRWGKTLTVLTLVIGIGLGCAFLYKAWLDPASVPNNFYKRNTP